MWDFQSYICMLSSVCLALKPISAMFSFVSFQRWRSNHSREKVNIQLRLTISWCCSSPFTRSSSLPSSSQKVADTITVTLVGETTGALGETSTKVQDKASWSWAPFCALEWRIWSLEDIRYVPSLVHCLVSLRSLGYHHDEYIHGTDGRRVPHFIACEFQYSRAIGRAVFDLLLTGELHSFIMKRVWWCSC